MCFIVELCGPRPLGDRSIFCRTNTFCGTLGFDTVEFSSGFITLLADASLPLLEKVQKVGC
jgi:hypothetical protein